MDQKKVIQQLIKIAEKQQKAIEKLAQQLQEVPAGGFPEQQDLKPNQQQHTDLMTRVLKANPNLANIVQSLTYAGPGNVNVTFKPGQSSDANFSTVVKALGAIGVNARLHEV